MEPPLLACESVLSEAQFLIDRFGGDSRSVLDLVERGMIEIAFALKDHIRRVRQLQQSYRDVPMALADACLVRMTELNVNSRVFTTDSDFRIYRRNGRQLIPLVAPP
jgi:uncharacterized protein